MEKDTLDKRLAVSTFAGWVVDSIVYIPKLVLAILRGA